MATTYDLTKGTAGSAYPASNLPKTFLIENTIDFEAQNLSADDVAQALKISAGTAVLFAGIHIKTAEGGTATADLGDGDDADGYLDGVDINAAAGVKYTSLSAYAASTTNADMDMTTPTQLYGLRGGKYYGADDTIDVTPKNNVDAAKLRVFAMVIDLND